MAQLPSFLSPGPFCSGSVARFEFEFFSAPPSEPSLPPPPGSDGQRKQLYFIKCMRNKMPCRMLLQENNQRQGCMMWPSFRGRYVQVPAQCVLLISFGFRHISKCFIPFFIQLFATDYSCSWSYFLIIYTVVTLNVLSLLKLEQQ